MTQFPTRSTRPRVLRRRSSCTLHCRWILELWRLWHGHEIVHFGPMPMALLHNSLASPASSCRVLGFPLNLIHLLVPPLPSPSPSRRTCHLKSHCNHASSVPSRSFISTIVDGLITRYAFLIVFLNVYLYTGCSKGIRAILWV